MVAAFLSGSINPPPEGWFFPCKTWKGQCLRNGLTVTVPAGAQQVLLFLAPEAGGDFKTLMGAVQEQTEISPSVRSGFDSSRSLSGHEARSGSSARYRDRIGSVRMKDVVVQTSYTAWVAARRKTSFVIFSVLNTEHIVADCTRTAARGGP
jgi:hypothetical protein